MSDTEAANDGLKKWTPKVHVPQPKEAGEPSDPDPALAGALGLTSTDSEKPEAQEEEPKGEKPKVAEPLKAEKEGKKTVDKYSGEIQKLSEDLYVHHLAKATNDTSHLQKLIHSSNGLDRKMARKILERNSEVFGASTIEDYQKKLALEGTDDVTERKIIEQDFEIKSIKAKQSEQEWSSWKQSRQVESGSEFDLELDKVHSEHPELPYIDALNLAKGRTGAVHSKGKESASTVTGGSSMPSQEDIFANPLARKLIRNPKEVKKFAQEYLS